VFLDRDGTLNADTDGVRAPEDLELLPGAADAVRWLNQTGWRAVVVTNQPAVAKGWTSESTLRRIHDKLESLLGREHAFLDRIYFCPHHPDKGFPGERPELKRACNCRKPEPGMIHAGMKELNIDPAQSWLVGDTTVDMETARRAGLRGILVQTGQAGRDGKFDLKPGHVAPNILEAVRHIEPVSHTS
jgi:histidinol-phosphate phosphatase family protein